jgi:hypothetical protein
MIATELTIDEAKKRIPVKKKVVYMDDLAAVGDVIISISDHLVPEGIRGVIFNINRQRNPLDESGYMSQYGVIWSNKTTHYYYSWEMKVLTQKTHVSIPVIAGYAFRGMMFLKNDLAAGQFDDVLTNL